MSILVLAGLLVAFPAAALAPQARVTPNNVTPPHIIGTVAVAAKVRANPGAWGSDTPLRGATAAADEYSYAYQWLLDGSEISGADGVSYTIKLADLGGLLSVQVRATSADGSGQAVSEAQRVRKGSIGARGRARVAGTARFLRTLRAVAPQWGRTPGSVSYRWLRNGLPVKGATKRTYKLGLADFDKKLKVRITARKRGFVPEVSDSRPTAKVGHRVGVKARASYSVITRGAISANVATFKKQVQQSFTDPRGWRGSGVRFTPVAKGGSFTVVLAEASTVPSFSSGCSAQYSCRVGRYVIINQTRWQQATPLWREVGQSVRSYRHLVVNHETGHWLGHGHRGCPGGGKLAPVMMQQSKGLAGCTANPWPTNSERRTPRFG